MIKLIHQLKYATTFVLFYLGFISFTSSGIYCWIPFLFTFFFVPGVELFLSPSTKNFSEIEEQLEKSNKIYDYILYIVPLVQFYALWTFLSGFQEPSLTQFEIAGRIIAMGLLCSIFGINVAHELGHRSNKGEQFLAKCLLLTSLYMHFFIEHNKGHHHKVGTPSDPSTAKLNQSVYAFYKQTFVGTYLHAWKIDFKEMLVFQLIQIAFVCSIYVWFGPQITVYFLLSALLGSTILETVNYIEHYGLSRELVRDKVYERVKPQHSWNSNHVLGRLLLFELSRHSDHHYLASRKYQVLRHMEDAPQMPTGYPGMILLSLIPPLWFRVMHKQMRKYDLL